MRTVRVQCCAKLNLVLEILGRRSDGYHNLSTIFQSITLADTLLVRPVASQTASLPELEVSGVSVPVIGNLCLRARDAFLQRFGGPQVTMSLHKAIPTGAGLGGGSSDAAGTLAALAHLHGGVPPQALADLAAELGSDVAFFLTGGTMLGEGRGEVLTPLEPFPPAWLVVAQPAVAISTPEAYGLLNSSHYSDGSYTKAFMQALSAGCDLRQVTQKLYNGFAQPVETKWPDTRALRERLLSLGALNALLTGSGSAVFGFFADSASAAQAAEQLTAEHFWAAVAEPTTQGLQVTDAVDEP